MHLVSRPAAQQQHRVSWVGFGSGRVGGWGGLAHNVVTSNLKFSWALTILEPTFVKIKGTHKTQRHISTSIVRHPPHPTFLMASFNVKQLV